MTQLQPLFKNTVSRLKEAGIDTPELDARILLAHVLGEDAASLNLLADKTVDVDQLESLVQLRLARKPIAKIMGEKEFWSLPFHTNEHTLDPRPDSEVLIEQILAHFKTAHAPQTILDLGTGTGCLLLTLLTEFADAKGVGADLSPDALAVAERNMQRHGLESRAQLVQSDWFENISGQFDLIVSNPPYIQMDEKSDLAPEVSNFDPALALYAEETGLACYRKILAEVRDYLVRGGTLVFEIGHTQAKDLVSMGQAAGFSHLKTAQDYGGRDRVVIFQYSI